MEIEIDWKSGVIILLFCFCLFSSCTQLSKLEDISTELCRTKDEVRELRNEIKKQDIEGVLLKVDQENGMDVLVFEERRVPVNLGSHEVYPGEWNCVRLNPRGYVEEVWLGEDWRDNDGSSYLNKDES